MTITLKIVAYFQDFQDSFAILLGIYADKFRECGWISQEVMADFRFSRLAAAVLLNFMKLGFFALPLKNL
jgi:hypothetical protein